MKDAIPLFKNIKREFQDNKHKQILLKYADNISKFKRNQYCIPNKHVGNQVNEFYSSNLNQLDYKQIKQELKSNLSFNANKRTKTTDDTFKLMKIDHANLTPRYLDYTDDYKDEDVVIVN